jgi:hypothetical protein
MALVDTSLTVSPTSSCTHTNRDTSGYSQSRTANAARNIGKAEAGEQNKTIQAIENGARTRHLQRLIVAVRQETMRKQLTFLLALFAIANASMADASAQWPDLRLVSIRANPFRLQFKSVIKLPDGSMRFSITGRGDRRTYFLKIGEEWKGFKILKYEEKAEQIEPHGVRPSVDRSVLVLQRGKKTIRLVKGRPVTFVEYSAQLLLMPDNTEMTVTEGAEFLIREVAFRMEQIDPKNIRVRIVHVESETEKWFEREDEGAEQSPRRDSERPADGPSSAGQARRSQGRLAPDRSAPRFAGKMN